MQSYLLHKRIILLTLQPLGCILFIFSGYIPGHSRYTALLLFSTLQYNLNSITFFCHVSLIYTKSIKPLDWASFIQVSNPFLQIFLMPAALTLSVINLFSSSDQKRLLLRLGENSRLVRRFEWETLFPFMLFFPVIWQILAISYIFF